MNKKNALIIGYAVAKKSKWFTMNVTVSIMQFSLIRWSVLFKNRILFFSTQILLQLKLMQKWSCSWIVEYEDKSSLTIGAEWNVFKMKYMKTMTIFLNFILYLENYSST